jgi:hypothetical protein
LEKIFSSEEKQKWVEKMQGFEFEIIFKKGKENVVTNAILRIEKASSLCSIKSSIPLWLEESLHEQKNENSMRHKIQYIKEGMNSMEHWKWKRDILWYKSRKFYALNQS